MRFKFFGCLSTAVIYCTMINSASATSKTPEQIEKFAQTRNLSIDLRQPVRASSVSDNRTVGLIAQSVYQDKIWPAIKRHVPNNGSKKSLLCVFSKARNLEPYNVLLEELYRESFGNGVAEKVGEFLNRNSHDFTYQFHMQSMNNGSVRINALDTRDRNINHNYIVDFRPDEKYEFINYGRLPRTAESQEKILQIYKRFLPGVLQRKCMANFQYLER
jgi:hypothetical protein